MHTYLNTYMTGHFPFASKTSGARQSSKFRGMSDGVLACHFRHFSSSPCFSWPSLSSFLAAADMTCSMGTGAAHAGVGTQPQHVNTQHASAHSTQPPNTRPHEAAVDVQRPRHARGPRSLAWSQRTVTAHSHRAQSQHTVTAYCHCAPPHHDTPAPSGAAKRPPRRSGAGCHRLRARRPAAEAGGQLEVGSWKLEVGSWKLGTTPDRTPGTR